MSAHTHPAYTAVPMNDDRLPTPAVYTLAQRCQRCDAAPYWPCKWSGSARGDFHAPRTDKGLAQLRHDIAAAPEPIHRDPGTCYCTLEIPNVNVAEDLDNATIHSRHTREAAELALDGRPPFRPPFRQWLRTHGDDNEAVATIASEILADKTWPRGAGSLVRYRAYLESQHASPEAIAAFEAAWSVYLDETAPSRAETETGSSLVIHIQIDPGPS